MNIARPDYVRTAGRAKNFLVKKHIASVPRATQEICVKPQLLIAKLISALMGELVWR